MPARKEGVGRRPLALRQDLSRRQCHAPHSRSHRMTKDLAASVRARCLNIAKSEGSNFNQLLVRLCPGAIPVPLEPICARDRFLLKGAPLFTLWYDMPHRPTRDADLLALGRATCNPSAKHSVISPPSRSMTVSPSIPKALPPKTSAREAGYAGARSITGELAKARCKTQIDIGFGDAGHPGPVQSEYPVLFEDFPAPRFADLSGLHRHLGKLPRHRPVWYDQQPGQGLPRSLGHAGSRIAEHEHAGASHLGNIHAARHGGTTDLPMGLSDEFAADPSRQALWSAFIRKNDLAMIPLADGSPNRSALSRRWGLRHAHRKPDAVRAGLYPRSRGGASRTERAAVVSCLRQPFPARSLAVLTRQILSTELVRASWS